MNASPGELRLWRKLHGCLSEEEKQVDSLEHNKAKSRANLAGRPRQSPAKRRPSEAELLYKMPEPAAASPAPALVKKGMSPLASPRGKALPPRARTVAPSPSRQRPPPISKPPLASAGSSRSSSARRQPSSPSARRQPTPPPHQPTGGSNGPSANPHVAKPVARSSCAQGRGTPSAVRARSSPAAQMMTGSSNDKSEAASNDDIGSASDEEKTDEVPESHTVADELDRGAIDAPCGSVDAVADEFDQIAAAAEAAAAAVAAVRNERVVGSAQPPAMEQRSLAQSLSDEYEATQNEPAANQALLTAQSRAPLPHKAMARSPPLSPKMAKAAACEDDGGSSYERCVSLIGELSLGEKRRLRDALVERIECEELTSMFERSSAN